GQLLQVAVGPHQVAHPMHQQVRIDRLGDEIGRPRLEGTVDGLRVTQTGNHKNRDVLPAEAVETRYPCRSRASFKMVRVNLSSSTIKTCALFWLVEVTGISDDLLNVSYQQKILQECNGHLAKTLSDRVWELVQPGRAPQTPKMFENCYKNPVAPV